MKATATLGHAYAYMRMCTHDPDLCTHAYAYTGMCMHARVPKTMKGKFSTLKLRFGTNLTSSGSCSKPLFSHYIKPYIVPVTPRTQVRAKHVTTTTHL